MSAQVDLYSTIHKGQRARFFKIAARAGTIDYADHKALDSLYDELRPFREEMCLHAALEEKFIHPLLSNRVPGGARELEADHRNMHQQIDDLLTHFDGLRVKTDFEKRSELALEFYRAWNRFISFYFTHINKEEENIQPSLWALCTNDELATVFKTIIASQKPDELMENLGMMLSASNLYERAGILMGGRAIMPPEAFQTVLKFAEQVLSPNDWLALKSKIGIT